MSPPSHTPSRSGHSGFTLIELLVSSALLMVAGGIIWQTWLTASESNSVIGHQTTHTDQMLQVFDLLGHELRAASLSTLEGLPGSELRYRAVEDVNGDGKVVNPDGAPELGQIRMIAQDSNGLLVLLQQEQPRVLANRLQPANADDPQASGVWFEREGEAVRITLRFQSKTRRGYAANDGYTFLVRPRNP